MLAALALVFGVGAPAGLCWAAEPPGPARSGGVPELLASVTILSETAMARESAAGVQPAPVMNEQNGHAKVLLWDELRAPPDLPPGTNTAVTITTGSGK